MAFLFSIDAHAAGGTCRIVHAGFPALRGADAAERHNFVRQSLDWVRTSLMHEPRGHPSAFGALLAPPVRGRSAYSLIFFDPAGYLNGCGHGTLCSVAVWQRMMGELDVPFDIDNPDGSVTTVVSAAGDGEQCTATLRMPTATVVADRIRLPWRGGIDAGVVRCGNLYLLVDAEQVGATAERQFSRDAQRDRILSEIREAAQNVCDVGDERTLEVVVYQRLEAGGGYETAVLFNGTQIDRSPCGTGSGALGCLLLQRGDIGADEWINTYGPARLPFSATVSPRADGAAGYEVSLRGTAYITGVHEWIVSADDPLRAGLPPLRRPDAGATDAIA